MADPEVLSGIAASSRGVVLAAEELTKCYGSLVAIDGLSLDVRRGEILGLLGPNGAGKTTTISMLCGLLRPDAGRVLLNGRPLTDGGADQRSRVGVCPQEIVLWAKLTCIEQLEFIGRMYGMPRTVARSRGTELLAAVGLEEKGGVLADRLSGGMKRRLNLAMAVVHEPEVVVLDEPEAGLDPQSRVRIREFIRSLTKHMAVILTTHNMDEADRVADRVAIIDHGRLLVLDTPEDLKHTVGQGDVIELTLRHGTEQVSVTVPSIAEQDTADRSITDQGAAAPSIPERAVAALSGLAGRAAVAVADGTLTVRALDAVTLLSEVTAGLAAAGVRYSDVRLRENTLEDVFIQLTGRRLRE